MRLQLNLSCAPGSKLSLDYHAALTGLLYRTLQKADPVFSQWLHDKGYDMESGKMFKLFCFSELRGMRDNQAAMLLFPKGVSTWQVSFMVEKPMEKFIEGVFRQATLEVGAHGTKVAFTVDSLEILTEPAFGSAVKLRAKTGIFLEEKLPDQSSGTYLSPQSPSFSRLFLRNLEHKVATIYPELPPPSIAPRLRILSDSKRWSVRTPHSAKHRLIGYYQFDFELIAPPEWIAVGYAAGFGSQNSLGFGFCDVV